MRFVGRVLARQLQDAEEELKEILKDWTLYGAYEGGDQKLSLLLQQHPELADNLDKGSKYKTLYRGMGLPERDMKTLLAGKLDPQKSFESWTVALHVAQEFSQLPYHCAGMYGVVFKRNVPDEDRLVYTGAYKFRETHEREFEVICYGTTYTAADIHQIWMKDGDTCEPKKLSLEQARQYVKEGFGGALWKKGKCC